MRPRARPLLAALVVSAVAGLARAEGAAVILPGYEDLFADMLGKGVALPGECRWAGAQIERVIVVSRYACASGEAVIELRDLDGAPAGSTRTGRFAVVARGTPPAGLVGALADRLRAREAEFHWGRAHANDPPPVDATVTRGLPAALAAGAVVAAAAGVAARRILGRGKGEAPATRKQKAIAIGVTALSAAVVCGAAHGALRALGAALVSKVSGGGAAAFATGSAIMLGCVIVATVAAAFLSRARGPLPPWAAVASLFAIYTAARYPFSLPRDDLHYFGRLSTPRPDQSSQPPRDGGPIYRINEHGFREPSFEEGRRPGTVRVALIGDSFVFGSGVAAPDTLSSKLSAELSRRFPGRAIEVLNLGVQGNNLASHVDLYEVAARRLEPDVVILCLTLVNDLSPWDGQVERREARRLGAFSFARWLLGDGAGWLWTSALDERSVTPRGLDHLDAELTRLSKLRAAAAHPPGLVVLTWGPVDPAIEARISKIEGAARAGVGETSLDDFIPGDGHPTGKGNERFARWVVEGMERDAVSRRMLFGNAP